jgi:peroxiredoxin
MVKGVNMAISIKEGSKAPNFALLDTDRKMRELKEFVKGSLVLAFYPGAFTGVCTKEMCALRDSLARMNSLNANVLAVSVNDPFSNKAFAEKNGLSFPLLSDFNREVVKKYGIVLEDFAGMKGYNVAKRSVFIIDKTGTIRFRWVSDDPGKEPDYGEIEMKLKEMK